MYTALNTLLNTLLQKMETFVNRAQTGLNQMLSSFAKSMKSVSVGAEGAVTYTPSARIVLPRFAAGGFPVEGQLFLANEAGPELVGQMGSRAAVANTAQIIEGIRRGVFEAMKAAAGSFSGGNGDINLTIDMDGEVVFKKVVRKDQEHVAMTGHSAFAY